MQVEAAELSKVSRPISVLPLAVVARWHSMPELPALSMRGICTGRLGLGVRWRALGRHSFAWNPRAFPLGRRWVQEDRGPVGVVARVLSPWATQSQPGPAPIQVRKGALKTGAWQPWVSEEELEKAELALGRRAFRDLILIVEARKEGLKVSAYSSLDDSHRGSPAHVGHPSQSSLAAHCPKYRRPGRNADHVRSPRITRMTRGVGPLPIVGGFLSVVVAGGATVADGSVSGHVLVVYGSVLRVVPLNVSRLTVRSSSIVLVRFVGMITLKVSIF